jgi:hypothetical protein
MSDLPKLRELVDVRFVREGDRELIVFFDRQRIAPSPLVIPRAFAAVLGMFTGLNTKDEILARHAGNGLTSEILEQLIREVDSALFLDSERFAKEEERVKKEFLSGSVRTPACAGAVYPASHDEMREFVSSSVSGASQGDPVKRDGTPLALVVPHVDYARGGRVYASVAEYLSGFSQRPDIVIMLGTSHCGGRSKYQLSRMDYQIPGVVFRNSGDLTGRIAKEYGEELSFQDEFLHANEHSLELPLPYLWHAWREYTGQSDWTSFIGGKEGHVCMLC